MPNGGSSADRVFPSRKTTAWPHTLLGEHFSRPQDEAKCCCTCALRTMHHGGYVVAIGKCSPDTLSLCLSGKDYFALGNSFSLDFLGMFYFYSIILKGFTVVNIYYISIFCYVLSRNGRLSFLSI